jgi:dTMP kinase
MRRRARGLLVALEGIDGAGKSTLARALTGSLRRRRIATGDWREPVDPVLGRLAQSAGARDAWTGAIYFTLDRFLARPALEAELRRRAVVVSDRSFYSTLAYQGSRLRPAQRSRLEELSRRATVRPDRVVLLELPPAEAVARMRRRARERGPLEYRAVLEGVARRYRAMARGSGWLVLDARRPTGELAAEVIAWLLPAVRTGAAGRS